MNAKQNRDRNSSEHQWEQDINFSVFATLRADQSLSLDKRTYHFLAGTGPTAPNVEFTTVDLTLGLATYKDDYTEYMKSIWSGNPERRPRDPGYHEFLVEQCLRDQMHCSHSGLLVDGWWGKANLIFPFAVYEAKKVAETIQKQDFRRSMLPKSTSECWMTSPVIRMIPRHISSLVTVSSIRYSYSLLVALTWNSGLPITFATHV